MKHLDSPYLIRCEEVYDYEKRIWILLELMKGSLTDLVLARQGDFTEEFVRWTLYQVAKGIEAMHD